MAGNEILQILIFSIFFGMALGHYNQKKPSSMVQMMDDLVHVMLQVTDYVMRFAPIGVFAAVASTITTQGLGVLVTFGKYMGSFCLALFSLWLVLIFAGYLLLGKDVFRLLKLVRGPMLIGFSTASSEAVYPKLMEQLEKFGIRPRVTGFVLPLGYSFNLDGSMMWRTTFAALFISQAYNLPLTLRAIHHVAGADGFQQRHCWCAACLTGRGGRGVADVRSARSRSADHPRC